MSVVAAVVGKFILDRHPGQYLTTKQPRSAHVYHTRWLNFTHVIIAKHVNQLLHNIWIYTLKGKLNELEIFFV
jgi:hypothetical protein